jgi:ABC-2 type transport system permease protein
LPKSVTDALIIAQIQLLSIWRMLIFFPIFYVLFPMTFLFFARNLTPPGQPLSTRLVTGSIVFTLGISIVNELAQNLSNQRFSNQLKLVMAQPVSKLSFAAGFVMAGITRGIFTAATILLFAPAAGVHIVFGVWLIPLTLLAALSLTGLALVIGTCSPTREVGSMLANMIGIMIVFLSPVYFPLSRLPEIWQWPARLSPYTHAANAIDGILSGSGVAYGEIAILTAITAVTLTLGVMGMRWREV